MDVFAKLDLKTIALLLDVDGTIIDIGPSPSEVHVSDALLRSLKRLFDLTGGAVALVSGRPIADLDRLFSPLRLPSVGGHGAEMRLRRQRGVFLGRSRCRTICASASPSAAGIESGRHRRGQGLFARAALPERAGAGRAPAPPHRWPAARRFPASRPNCCWARRCSRSSGRASAKAKASAN